MLCFIITAATTTAEKLPTQMYEIDRNRKRFHILEIPL